jgi:serine/threonine-protein kinase
VNRDVRESSLNVAADDARDQALANLLDELTRRATQGKTVDIEAIGRQHPEFADELRQLWGAMMLADAVGRHASKADTSANNTGLVASVEFDLPYQFGDYQLVEELGRGGMGVVFRARQLSLKREVAIKMLLRGQLASPDDKTRFLHEAESVARLNHPAVVPVYEVGEEEGRLFFSMKYVRGETLSSRLAEGALPPRETARMLSAVCRAVHYAHCEGVLHRDLKPSNIIIDENDDPHVSDFGLARPIAGAADLTRTGAVLGTPAYMAPEQAAGNRGQVGTQSDVYSLGTILYHMLTGRPPFQARSPVDVVLMVLEQDPPLPRLVNPAVDRDLEMIALRCLQKPPELRYGSAEALADDLDAYLRDEPIAARSGHISHVVARLFRETHHASILQNWGVLWMWHSLVLLVVCLLTNGLQAWGVTNRWNYFFLWTAGLGTWASVFWSLRRRMGPVTFVERQIAHIWAASMASIALLFPLEYALRFPVLKLSPILGLSSGMVFLIKAGMLSGTFYIQAAALFLCSFAMARWPQFAHTIFGFVSAACFFVPGWKYYRQRRYQNGE